MVTRFPRLFVMLAGPASVSERAQLQAEIDAAREKHRATNHLTARLRAFTTDEVAAAAGPAKTPRITLLNILGA